MLGDTGVETTTTAGNRRYCAHVQDFLRSTTFAAERATNRNASSLPRGFTTQHVHNHRRSSSQQTHPSHLHQQEISSSSSSSKPLKGIRRHRHSFSSHQHPTRRLKCVEIPDHELVNPDDEPSIVITQHNQLQHDQELTDRTGSTRHLNTFVLPRFVVENFDDLPRQHPANQRLFDPSELLRTLQALPAELLFWPPPAGPTATGEASGNFIPTFESNNNQESSPLAGFDFVSQSSAVIDDINHLNLWPPEEFRSSSSPQQGASEGESLRRSRFSSVRCLDEGLQEGDDSNANSAAIQNQNQQEQILDGIPPQFLLPSVHFEDSLPVRSSNKDQQASSGSLPRIAVDADRGFDIGDLEHRHHHHRPHCHAENHVRYHSLKRHHRKSRHQQHLEQETDPQSSQQQHRCRTSASPGRLKARSQFNLDKVDCVNSHRPHQHQHHQHRHHQHHNNHLSNNSSHLAKSDPLLWDLPTPPLPPKKRTGLLPTFIQADPESDSSFGDASDDEMKSKQWFIIGLVIIFTCGVGLGVGLPLALKRQLTLEERLDIVYNVLKEVPLIDGHNDMPWNIRQFHHNQLQTVNLSADLRSVYPWNSSNWSHTDLHRLREGRIGAQFWAAYAPCRTQDFNAVQMTIEQIDLIKRMVTLYPEFLRLAVSPEEIRQVHGAGFTASLIGIEGGHSLGNSLSVLRMMYDLGARYLTLTHNCDTPWAEADGTKDDYVSSGGSNRQRWKRSVGLSDFGKTVIAEMNRLGMMVDLSHVSYATIRAVLDIAKAPVIFTHSASRTICNHSRNIPDEILRDVARNGGIVMVPFYPDFVACSRSGTMQHVIDHINHIRDVAGIHHVGIGSDFDGINRTIQGLEDVAKYPYLLAELLVDGRWTVEELKKLAGQNFLRVFEEVVRVSKEMQKTGILPAEELIPLADLDEISNCTYNGT